MKEPMHEVDQLEKEAKFTIIRLEDESNHESNIVENSMRELGRVCNDCRKWIYENANSEETAIKIEKLKTDTKKILSTTKDKLDEFNSREDVITGKEKLSTTKKKVCSAVNSGFDELLKNEYVSKTIDTISDSVETIRKDERVQNNVKKLKKGTLKLAEKAFNKLQRALDTNDKEES